MNQNFRDAALYADIKSLNEFIATEPNLVHEVDKFEFTALHEAVGEHTLEVVQILIAAGANVNAQNDSGIAPLHLVAYDYIAEELIKAGAKIQIKEQNGGTPLHIQAENPESIEVIEVLLKHGADANIKDNSDLSVLDIAKGYGDDQMVSLIKSYIA